MKAKFTISNMLIAVSAVFTVLAMMKSSYYDYGMNTYFLWEGQYHIYAIQFFTSQFLHGGVFHLLMNALFIFFFGNIVEQVLGDKKYINFFVFSAIFTGIGLSLFAGGNTIGISSFAMALIAYYTLHLRAHNNPDYKGGITALVLNVLIGFYPGISLLGHVFGAISGALFYYLLKVLKK